MKFISEKKQNLSDSSSIAILSTLRYSHLLKSDEHFDSSIKYQRISKIDSGLDFGWAMNGWMQKLLIFSINHYLS